MINAVISLNNKFGVKIYFDEKDRKIYKTKIVFQNLIDMNTTKIPNDIVTFFKNYLTMPTNYLMPYLIWDNITDKFKNIYLLLMQIEPGKTITYSELAKKAGIENGARVVGNAMARNRFPLIIPCHRVVSKKGIGGFFYGPTYKKLILQWEGVNDFMACKKQR